MLSQFTVFAQQTLSDSLKHALTNARTDSVRFNRLMDLGWEYSEKNRDTSLSYDQRALALAKKNGHALDMLLSFTLMMISPFALDVCHRYFRLIIGTSGFLLLINRVKSVIEEVEHKEGEGSEFVILLPLNNTI